MDESSSSSLSPSSTSPIPSFTHAPVPSLSTGSSFLSTIFAPSSLVVFVTPSIPIPSFPPTSSSLPTTLASSVFSHPVFFVTNIRNYVVETLDHTNFCVWKELMIPVLKSKGVYGHVDGSDSCPSPNSLDFDYWMQVDYQVLSWIQATISKDILQFILQPGKQLTAKLAWESIHQLYQSQLSAAALQLTQEFSGIQKQSSQSVMDYLQYVKGLSDWLFGIGHPVSDKDLVLRTIAGLDHSFLVAKRTIPQRVPFPTFLELRSLLLIEEANILQESSNSSLMNGSSSSSQLLQLTRLSDLQIHYAAHLQRAVMYSWPIHQLDVKNAFLHGRLFEVVYMSQPPGFIDPKYLDYVCRLNRALYGLKQAPHAWFQRFASFLFTHDFSQARLDSSMFLYHSNGAMAILLLYVDDIVLTASTKLLLHAIISLLKMVTPMAPKAKLFSTDSPAYSDPAFYRSIVGALQYLTFTRPDIAFAVGQKQNTVARLSAEAEYRAIANVVAEYVPSFAQPADVLTKALSSALFRSQRSNLSVLCSPAQIAGG
ncbi:hypothetical protein SLEP1_g46511 [Rubroshorea leprosula]|uniref:Reverse transcriptase Ty1/copia-type domain-containing protein n=1 Tax=Rubroshorea leprosula TaxID=152421 RepID=A0AAV5LQ56_9ROSI|nr:hypothetical protein SLEP1_g46511 [Rubroshorea leprosula]